jgi:hypothetical protein
MSTRYVDDDRTMTDKALRLGQDAERKKVVKAMKVLQRWMIDETSIVISNKLYAWDS